MQRAALVLALAAVAVAPSAHAADIICGWIQNPVAREWMITDSRRTFTIMGQADTDDGPPGMDRIGDLSAKENLNGGRTACGCLRGDVRGARIAAIEAFVQKPLAACRSDTSLPPPLD